MTTPNVNYPFGLKPLKSPSGTARINSYADYRIADQYNTAIPFQAVVKRSGTNNEIQAAADGTTATVGVFLGCEYQDSIGNFIRSKNWLASTVTLNAAGAHAFVADDPKQLFLARMSGALVAADVGQFAGMTVGAADGNGVSTTSVNSSDITGTADVFKIISLYNDGLNAFGNYSLVKVMLGIHEYNAPAAS